jgi:four helix bundle protein
MKIEKFEDIEAWKEARELVKEIYSYFSANKDYSFRYQIQRAAISIMSNIACPVK